MLLHVELLLEKNQIAFDKRELEFQIKSHPAYPSLYAITEVLEHFKITHVAARVPKTMESLAKLPDYFIAQLGQERPGGLYFVERSKGQYVIRGLAGQSKKVAEDEFLEVFTGVVLGVEKNEEVSLGKPSNKTLSKLGLVMLMAGILAIAFLSMAGMASLLLLFTALAGVFMSVIILQQELGIKTSVGDVLCNTDLKKSNCQTVLNSEGARIMGKYKLSDLSLIYFLGLSVSIFLLSVQGLHLMPVFVLALLGLPVTFYSIYYQAFKVKSWCFLCLSIVAILWIQAGWVLSFETDNLAMILEVKEVLSLGVGLLAGILAWAFIKPMHSELEEGRGYKLGFYQFKNNYRIFSALLKAQTRIETQLEESTEIVFGNKHSKLELMVVTNPFCGHCRAVHTMVEDILDRYYDLVRVVIRFNINLAEPDQDLIDMTTNLLHIYTTRGEKDCLEAMHDAYDKSKRDSWVEQWAGSEDINAYFLQDIKQQREWCKDHKVNFTPALLINGRALPTEYERKDLALFIEDLYDTTTQENSMEEVLMT